MRDFEWSPQSSIISYWVPEVDACPARVCLVAIPSRSEVRVRNLYNVSDCKLHWQKSGEHLAVKVDRYGKKKEEENGDIKYTVGVVSMVTQLCNIRLTHISSEKLSERLCNKYQADAQLLNLIELLTLRNAPL